MNEAAGGDLRPDGAAVAATNPEPAAPPGSAASALPAHDGDAPAVAVSATDSADQNAGGQNASGPDVANQDDVTGTNAAAAGKSSDDSRKAANGTGSRRPRSGSSRGGSRSGSKTAGADDNSKTDTAGRRAGGRAGGSTKSSTGRKSRSRKSADRATAANAATGRSAVQSAAANATREAVEAINATKASRIVRQDDPPPAPVTEPSFPLDMKVGDYLRSIREQNRLSIRQIADTLRIQDRYVEAIEGSRYRELPGVAYASGFVRGYADLFGADSDEAAIRYKEEAADYAAQASVAVAPSADETWFPKGRMVALSVILAAGAYIGWLVYGDSQRNRSQVASVPPHLEQLAGDTAPDVAGTGTAGPTTNGPATNGPATNDPATNDPATNGPARQPVLPTARLSAPTRDGATDGIGATGTPQRTIGTTGDTLPGSEWESIPRLAPTSTVESGPTPEVGAILPPVAATISSSDRSESAGSESAGSESVGSVAGARPNAAAGNDDATVDPTAPTVPAPRASVTAPAPSPSNGTDWTQTAGEPTSTPAPAPTSPTSAAASEPPAAHDGRILLVATGESWVRVRDSDGNTVFAGVMQPGDQYSVPNTTGMTMLTGNAGHVYFMVDGLRVEPIGPQGSVRRGVQLNPTLLLSGEAYPGGSR